MKGIKLRPFTAQGRTVEIYYVPISDEKGTVTRGLAVKDKEMYKIYINSAISFILQKHTLGHELAHVFCGHLDAKNPDRAAQEKEADQKGLGLLRRIYTRKTVTSAVSS